MPVVRVKNLPEEKQCLKFGGYKCNCRWADPEKRRKELKKLRQKQGAYSFINLLDTGVAQAYETERQALCEGTPPRLWDRIKYKLRIRII